ncbi:polysaccharide deacetylase family protein [Candidatus Woesearchaeota archaeon]|jgi:peptidoglycan-N-acetylglucosamine deacetylase|nr:polysaccharide deacetylase family protein [Candidatus Woesearchaeota archaeon]
MKFSIKKTNYLKKRQFIALISLTILTILIISLILFLQPYQKIHWKSSSNSIGNKVAITIDDGPSKFTEPILKILKSTNTKATFFLLGENIAKYPNITKKITNTQEFGIHSYSHPKLPFTTKTKFEQEIVSTLNILNKTTNKTTNLFRPPLGIILPSQIKFLNQQGINIINFNVNSKDYQSISSDEIITNVLNNVKSGDIILLHDSGGKTRQPTVDALSKIIEGLKEKNLTPVTISELLELN